MNTIVTFELKGDLQRPGFKPLMWRLASEAGLGGWITDEETGDGVLLRLEGDEERIRAFIRPIPGKLFPHYKLTSISVRKSRRDPGDGQRRPFYIISGGNTVMPEVPVDRVVCPTCLAEMKDPKSRRYGYPFFSCPDCGAGYALLQRNPFIRKNTSYAAFPPCRSCREDGDGIRACPDCGPRLFLLDSEGEFADDSDCICNARCDLKRGSLLALQSRYGGFHLFVDAANPDALRRLRERRKLPARPIAVMARNMEAVRRICRCSAEEEKLLTSPVAPVVILDVLETASGILPVELLSPDGPRLGVSLPSSGLTHLLFDHGEHPDAPPPFEYLATVSSNWHGKMNLNSFDEQVLALRGTADVFLCNDLLSGMHNPMSVAVVRDGAPQIWRRSRGYVPGPILTQTPLRRNAVAFGTDINGAVALASGDRIIPSQHLGDILNSEASGRLTHLLEHFTGIFDTVPDVVACDMNPNLRSSEEALRFSQRYCLPLITVQTHHAQALSGMVENKLEHALAFVLDNGEPGPDGVYWGAELLDVDVTSFRRLGTFQPVQLLGRENALSRPVRQFIGRLFEAGVDLTDAHLERFRISGEEVAMWRRTSGRSLTTHAAARLFDAVSAGLGLAPDFVGYRGQTAARLEYAAMRAPGGLKNVPGWMYDKFSFTESVDDTPKKVIDWTPLFRNFADLSWVKAEDVPALALAFHAKIADAVACLAHYGVSRTGVRDILLSGSLFMNGILLELVQGKLRSEGYRVYIHRNVPMDGSGLCVGQAWHAAR